MSGPQFALLYTKEFAPGHVRGLSCSENYDLKAEKWPRSAEMRKGKKPETEQREKLGLGSRGPGSLPPHPINLAALMSVGWPGPRPEASCGEGGIVSGSRNREERMQNFQKAANKSSALAGSPEVSQLSSRLKYPE